MFKNPPSFPPPLKRNHPTPLAPLMIAPHAVEAIVHILHVQDPPAAAADDVVERVFVFVPGGFGFGFAAGWGCGLGEGGGGLGGGHFLWRGWNKGKRGAGWIS